MTEGKLERDARRNAGLGEMHVRTEAQPWVAFAPGIDFKLLRASRETGAWSVMLKCAAGASLPRHEHLAAAEYLMISGRMDIIGGAERGGVTALAGDYGYEANGAWHDETAFPEESLLYFASLGPIRFTDDEDTTLIIYDHRVMRELAEAGRAG